VSYYNHITDDLDAILSVLPDDIRAALQQVGRRDELLEVILDLGRVPTARFTDGEVVLRETEVVHDEVQYVVDRTGEFDADNRAGIARTLHRIGKRSSALQQELGREPTDEEIAKALSDTVENVRSARRMTAAEMSLDAPVDRTDRDAATLGERFAGQEGGEIEERTDTNLMREFIDNALEKYLTPRERRILYLYYGLEEGAEGMTLEKIGEIMGVTRERIRQIRERAFEKLRESPQGEALKGFWVAA